MLFANLVFLTLALVGHAALWVGVVNRWHGTGYPRKFVKRVTLIFYAALYGIPALILWHWLALDPELSWLRRGGPPLDASALYAAFCAVYGASHLPRWAWARIKDRSLLSGIRLCSERIVDISEVVGSAPTTSPRTRFFCRLPFNQLWQLRVAEFELTLPSLPRSLDGMSICHVTDLHFSSRIERSYFDEIVRLTNEMEVDLIALTGDVCDSARYIDWIPETLGQMKARVAKLFVLGNHDLRTRQVPRLRETLDQAGFLDVAGRCVPLAGLPVVVAGNELPWFPNAIPKIAGMPAGAFKLLLSHSPDQLGWACKQGFELMLAGHTHGGQIRFPIAGPVICPSRHGTKYASGFFRADPTLLHVSRGTASLFPYRLNCRPELIKLVLRAAPEKDLQHAADDHRQQPRANPALT